MKKKVGTLPSVPEAPNSMQAGHALKEILGERAVRQLAKNISLVESSFNTRLFIASALKGLSELELKARAIHIATALRSTLPERYERGLGVLVDSLSPPMETAELMGLSGFFYLPHSAYIELYGVDPAFNGGRDPFEASMTGMYELTKRFTAEFAVRPSLLADQSRVLKKLKGWLKDSNPHVRRFCSEGIRPRLPWGLRIPSLVRDPKPLLPFLEALKDDRELYVRRSVANSLGDVAKDHLPLVIEVCERWLQGAEEERRWVVRHALRYPDKKGIKKASQLRRAAGLRERKR